MTQLIIRDLSDSKVLDTTDLNEIKGGMYQPSYPSLFGSSTAFADGYANAIGPNGSYANTYTNAFAYKDPYNFVTVASAQSNAVAMAY